MRNIFALMIVLAVTAAGDAQTGARGSIESELQRLEAGKWDPASAALARKEASGGPAAVMALFADDFLSVEYGADVTGGVRRKTRAEVFSGPPLPAAKFELGIGGSSTRRTMRSSFRTE